MGVLVSSAQATGLKSPQSAQIPDEIGWDDILAVCTYIRNQANVFLSAYHYAIDFLGSVVQPKERVSC
jgi:hypothetical protein